MNPLVPVPTSPTQLNPAINSNPALLSLHLLAQDDSLFDLESFTPQALQHEYMVYSALVPSGSLFRFNYLVETPHFFHKLRLSEMGLMGHLVNLSDDLRVMHFAEQVESLMREDHFWRSQVSGKTSPQTLEQALASTAQLDTPDHHLGLLSLVSAEFGPSAKVPPTFPVSVVVPRLTTKALSESARRVSHPLSGRVTIERPITVRLACVRWSRSPAPHLTLLLPLCLQRAELAARKPLVQHATQLGLLWARVLPGQVKWSAVGEDPDTEPHAPDWKPISAEIKSLVTAHRRR